MTTTTVDPRTVRSALQLAARAPSVHNTQPWKWRVGDSSVELLADEARRLRATDQDGRDLMLSCGAALHHLRVATSEAGPAMRAARPGSNSRLGPSRAPT